MQEQLQTAIASLKLTKDFLVIVGKALAHERKDEYKSMLNFCSEELSVTEQSLKKLMEEQNNET